MYKIRVNIPVTVNVHGLSDAEALSNAIDKVVSSYETVPTFDPMLLDGIRDLAESGTMYPEVYAEILDCAVEITEYYTDRVGSNTP